MKKFALITAIVLLVLSFLVIVWRLQGVVFIFLVALIIATALEQPVDAVTARGAPRWLAVLLLYSATLLSFGVIAAFVLTPLSRELDPFAQELLSRYSTVEQQLAQMADERRAIFVTRLPRTDDLAAMIVANPDTGMADGIMAGAQRLLGMAGELALALVIAIYWSMDSTRFERLWLSLLAPRRRTQARRFLSRLERNVGAYVRSEVLQTLLAGALLTALYALVGVRFPFLLATFVALTWLVPIYGGALAVILAATVGWLAGWPTAALATGATLLVLALMEYAVQPRLYAGRRYWGLLAVILMLMLGDVFGLLGLLLAPPVAFVVQMVLDGILERDQAFADSPVEETLAAVRSDLDALKQRIAAQNVELPATVSNIAGRLDKLVETVEQSAA
jgi:putative permease